MPIGIRVAGRSTDFADFSPTRELGLFVWRGLQPRQSLTDAVTLRCLGMVARPEKGRHGVYPSCENVSRDLENIWRSLCLRCAGLMRSVKNLFLPFQIYPTGSLGVKQKRIAQPKTSFKRENAMRLLHI